MRIGIVKPDYGVVGGFELNLGRITEELERRGHDVRWFQVPVGALGRAPFDVPVPEDAEARIPEFLSYLRLVEAFQRLDLRAMDVVVTTQPPSYVVEHPRKLALFYHHWRVFYDLSDLFVRAGFAAEDDHRRAQAAVRRIDRPHLAGVRWYLAGSPTVRRRLEHFNGVRDNASLCLVPSPQPFGQGGGGGRDAHILCVSRHEWPKRTELFVHAMKHLPRQQGVSVGGGGRLGWVQRIDRALSRRGAELDAVSAEALWMRPHVHRPPLRARSRRSNVRFAGHVSTGELERLYRDALCVVAPAFDEDYGHTSLEAMSFGKPVIVCEDGGGLADMVEDAATGFVVRPDGRSIAEAVQRLAEDRGLAARMGQRAHEVSRGYTWDRAMAQVESGLERVVG
jgi:glycosyltransferase involved in cell wall biosynthesis